MIQNSLLGYLLNVPIEFTFYYFEEIETFKKHKLY